MPFLPADHPIPPGLEHERFRVRPITINDVIRDYALQYIVPMLRGTQPDRQKIEEALPKLERDLALLDEAYARQPYLGGENVCLADLFVAPILHTVELLDWATGGPVPKGVQP